MCPLKVLYHGLFSDLYFVILESSGAAAHDQWGVQKPAHLALCWQPPVMLHWTYHMFLERGQKRRQSQRAEPTPGLGGVATNVGEELVPFCDITTGGHFCKALSGAKKIDGFRAWHQNL